MTTRTSLYRHYSAEGDLLYVGVSLSALTRLGQHQQHSHWFDRISRVEIEHFDTREEALEAEYRAVQDEKPLHNRNLKKQRKGDRTRFEDQELQSQLEKAKAGITNRIVNMEPFYDLNGVARLLCTSRGSVRSLIDKGHLRAVVLKETTRIRDGKPVRSAKLGVTGWQIIDYLENLEQGTFL